MLTETKRLKVSEIEVLEQLLLHRVLDVVQSELDFSLRLLDQEPVFLDHVWVVGIEVSVFELWGFPLRLLR